MASLVLLSMHTAPTLPALSADTASGHVPEIDNAEEELRLAFDTLNEADQLGISYIQVSRLVEQLNLALTLLVDAKTAQISSNDSLVTEFASRSAATSKVVRQKAEELRDTASKTLSTSRLLVIALAPVAGFVAAAIFYAVYRARRPQTEKILRMGIRRNEERG